MIYHAEFMFCSAFLREVGEIVDYGISITMLYTMIRSVSLSGYDVDTFCRDNGLDPRLLQDPEARIGAEQHVKLACAAAELLEDEHFGLHQGSQMEMADLGVLGYTMVHSGTIGECIHAYQRYYATVCSGYDIRLSRQGSEAVLTLSLEELSYPPSRHCVDDMVSSLVHIMIRLSGRAIEFSRITLMHPEPDSGDEYRKVLGVQPEFNKEHTSLYFPQKVLEYPVLYADVRLAGWFEERTSDVLLKLKAGRHFTDELTRWIMEQLRVSLPSISDAAAYFHMSTRTLQAKLQQENTTYTRLLNDIRKELALRYLKEPEQSIADIAYLLHFSEDSAFQHAFKKWTGLAPGQYRTIGAK
ncbi:AraC family transcriptional regulator [Paenibacillus sp. FSL H7-0326]|uniref:AraC family transcriptional regulator n=2 Tax=unclassified Paenibacillus TaxID=185978 RepID=UPI0009F9F6B2|nr:AraC family transcriptional regulator [Paenibacillus sp. FSL H7-0326]